MQPNENFSGRGRSQHLCRECANLGTEELAFRQVLRDMENCVTREGIIPRKCLKKFEEFLNHEDPRIRACAEEILGETADDRSLPLEIADQEEAGHQQRLQARRRSEHVTESDAQAGESEDSDQVTDIPF
jgi:hypothetical protein